MLFLIGSQLKDCVAFLSESFAYTLRFAANVNDVRCTADYKLGGVKTWKVNRVLEKK